MTFSKDSTLKNKLEQLRLKRDAKFAEIVSCLSSQLCSASYGDAQRLIEKAEELTDEWAAAQAYPRTPELSTALQILLNEHQEICEKILEILDSGEV
jgi:hypothetical protein